MIINWFLLVRNCQKRVNVRGIDCKINTLNTYKRIHVKEQLLKIKLIICYTFILPGKQLQHLSNSQGRWYLITLFLTDHIIRVIHISVSWNSKKKIKIQSNWWLSSIFLSAFTRVSLQESRFLSKSQLILRILDLTPTSTFSRILISAI